MPKKPSQFEEEALRIVEELKTLDPSSDEYAAAVKNLETLQKSQSYTKDRRITPDTILLVAANIAGILLVLQFENAHVLTSKALSFVAKTKL